jgi:integral membrane protein
MMPKASPSVGDAMISRTPTTRNRQRATTALVRTFCLVAVAEGGLLPAILLVAVIHWVTGWGSAEVVLIGATHGAVFTLYMLLVPLVARSLHWSLKTTGTAFCVAFVPFLPWAFERTIRKDIADAMPAGRGQARA